MPKTTPEKPEDNFARFDDAIGKLFKASKADIEKKAAAEKREREKKRKAG